MSRRRAALAVSMPVMRLMGMEGMKNTEQQRRRWYGETEEGRVVSGIEQVSRVTRHSAATGGHVPRVGRGGMAPEEAGPSQEGPGCRHLQAPSSRAHENCHVLHV